MKENNKSFLENENFNQTLTLEINKNSPFHKSAAELINSKEFNSILISNKTVIFHRNDDFYSFYCLKNMELVEIEELIKIVLSKHLIQENILMLHASATFDNEKNCANIFIGPSGAGKSTIASFSINETLQDDTFCIKFEKDKFNLFTIPFRRDYKKLNVSVKSVSIYRIFKSDRNYLSNLNFSSQLMHFLTSVWSFDELSVESKINNRRIFKLATKLLRECELTELHFTKTGDFNKLIN